MNRLFIGVLVFAACSLLLITEGISQDDGNIWTAETEGTGVITNNDLASARNNAINNALRNAVEQAVATLDPLQTLDRKSKAIRDGIYAKSDQYIHDYKISSERQVQNTYTVNVRSAVFVDSLRDDLQTLGLLKIDNNRVPSTEIAVTVKGLTSCADYVRARELLRTKVKGVKNVYQRQIAWDMARLGLDFQGTVQSFSDELIRTGHFSLIIGLIDENYFEVTFLK
ncbi:MAG: flagellar assembly protein T N-terminal domain-containing protein [Syntrophales bacterium]